jgi:flagellar biosynthetic protein FlhB
MSEQAKTEKPTQRRRNEARRQGRVAISNEFNSALVLLGVGAALTLFGPTIFGRLEETMREGLVRAGNPKAASADGVSGLVTWALESFALAVAPIVSVAAGIGVLASVAQVGFRFTPYALKPSFANLNPIRGLKQIVGPTGLVEAAKAIVKLSIVGGAAFVVIWPKLPDLVALTGLPPGAMVGQLAGLMRDLLLRVGAAFLLVAAGDYAWRRRKHEHELKMSRSDLKRELRQTELPSEVRTAIRRRQLQLARKRMLADVPTATVVLVNPTHFAVALRYDGTVPAPEVVAKGADLIAATIRRIAEEHDVPVLHAPALARALYREVDIGQMIPEQFFAAVAEVLAFVFRTAKRRPRQRLKVRRRTPISGAHAVSSSPPH